jgi:hypothetical protein
MWKMKVASFNESDVDALYQDMLGVKTRLEIPQFLKRNGRNRRICEVGVCKGDYFSELLKCKPEMAVGIDWWTATPSMGLTQDKIDGWYAGFIRKFCMVPNVMAIRQKSDRCRDIFDDGFFDFVYIDANHRKPYVASDLDAWWSKVRVGGIMAGHDYVVDKRNCPDALKMGVIEAVDEFRIQHGITRFVVTKDEYKSWLMIKA